MTTFFACHIASEFDAEGIMGAKVPSVTRYVVRRSTEQRVALQAIILQG